jgi:hypothetical protein
MVAIYTATVKETAVKVFLEGKHTQYPSIPLENEGKTVKLTSCCLYPEVVSHN